MKWLIQANLKCTMDLHVNVFGMSFFAKDLQEDVVESFLEVQRLDPLEVHLGEEIAEGEEAHICFASCRKFNTPAVVKVF